MNNGSYNYVRKRGESLILADLGIAYGDQVGKRRSISSRIGTAYIQRDGRPYKERQLTGRVGRVQPGAAFSHSVSVTDSRPLSGTRPKVRHDA